MAQFLLTFALVSALILGCQPRAYAQSTPPDEQRGSNYDPPPPVKLKTEPAARPEADKPFMAMQEVDWASRDTWVKLALLVGSIVLARRAFRQMKDYH